MEILWDGNLRYEKMRGRMRWKCDRRYKKYLEILKRIWERTWDENMREDIEKIWDENELKYKMIREWQETMKENMGENIALFER